MPMNSAQWLNYSLHFNLEATKDLGESSFFINTYLEGYHEKEESYMAAWLFSSPGRQQRSARPVFTLNALDIFAVCG